MYIYDLSKNFNLFYTTYQISLNILYDQMMRPFRLNDIINSDYLKQASKILQVK